MKLCRYDGDRVGVVQGDVMHDVTRCLEDLPSMRYPFPQHDQFIARLPDLMPKIVAAAATGASKPLDQVRLDLPVVNPGKIIAAPVNYSKHLDEVRDQADLNHGNESHMRHIREIGLFLKANSSLIGPSEAVRIGRPDRRNDHEIELAVVIGKAGKDIGPEEALSYVAGYAIGLDMTVRGPEDRSFRKSLDTYTVLGPWMVTAEELPDPSALDLVLTVNGEMRQKANTRDLVLSVPELIAMASSFYTLHPGDLILTGTPEGVAPVEPGDVMQATIERIGTMTVPVIG